MSTNNEAIRLNVINPKLKNKNVIVRILRLRVQKDKLSKEVLKMIVIDEWANASDSNAKETKEFAEWILKVDDGTTGEILGDGESYVTLLENILIRDATNPIVALVENTYHDVMYNASDLENFKDRAILAPTNEMINMINDYVMSLISTKERVYLSLDSICKEDRQVDLHEDVFSVEYLNTIKCSGLLNHEIKLKEGCIIMLLRNIDPSNELCNDTRLIVTQLGKRVIEGKLILGKNAGKKFPTVRMIMSPSDFTKFPI